MASPYVANLNQIGQAFLRPKGQMADWQHAARTFVDDYYRLAPKAKFLYHVYFDINPSAVMLPQLTQRHRNEIGLLVRSVDLPKFTIKTQTLNQYNRKKAVQLSHEYTPMTFRFIDDRTHIINMMWQSYYKYYYADPVTAEISGAYAKNTYKAWSTVRGPHGFDNNSTIPFFNEIILYQINKREFVSYTLVNPLIQTFSHDTVNSSDSGTNPAECQMGIIFEAVKYDSGTTSGGRIKAFGQEHYDKLPSPLSVLGGGTRSILGPGGLVDGAGTILDQIKKGNLINAAIGAKNFYDNSKRLTKAGIKQELIPKLTGLAIVAAGSVLGGLRNTTIPLLTSPSKTNASPTFQSNPSQPAGGGV
jgi:hypothetical protein